MRLVDKVYISAPLDEKLACSKMKGEIHGMLKLKQ